MRPYLYRNSLGSIFYSSQSLYFRSTACYRADLFSINIASCTRNLSVLYLAPSKASFNSLVSSRQFSLPISSNVSGLRSVSRSISTNSAIHPIPHSFSTMPAPLLKLLSNCRSNTFSPFSTLLSCSLPLSTYSSYSCFSQTHTKPHFDTLDSHPLSWPRALTFHSSSLLFSSPSRNSRSRSRQDMLSCLASSPPSSHATRSDCLLQVAVKFPLLKSPSSFRSMCRIDSLFSVLLGQRVCQQRWVPIRRFFPLSLSIKEPNFRLCTSLRLSGLLANFCHARLLTKSRL